MRRLLAGCAVLATLTLAAPATAAVPAITAVSPAPNGNAPRGGSFIATAELSGPGATTATLTLTPDGGSTPTVATPLKLSGDGTSASAAIGGLADGPYVASWEIDGDDAGHTTTYSSFVVGLGIPVQAPFAPATAVGDGSLYLQGAGRLTGYRFRNFVETGPAGEHPRGWLSTDSPYASHATVTCTSIRPDAAVLGYRIDAGDYAGQGWLVSVQYPGPGGGGGYVVYAGLLAAPPTDCPAPGDPQPAGFAGLASGPVTDGTLNKSTTPPAGPPSIIDVRPRPNTWVALGAIPAFAGLNGDAGGAVDLTLYPDGGSTPVSVVTLAPGAGGLDAEGAVAGLSPGAYVAVWTLTRGDGSKSTTLSSFGAGAPISRPPRPGEVEARRAEVQCGRVASGRVGCIVGLPNMESGRAVFAISHKKRTLHRGWLRFVRGTARLRNVGRLAAGRYRLTVSSPRRHRVLAKLSFRLR